MIAQQLTLTDALDAVGMHVITDADLAMRARDRGMRRVLDTDDPWLLRAHEAIDFLAETGQPFSADEVRDRAGDPASPNRMGAVVNAAAKAGRIRFVGFTRSSRVVGHHNRVALWEGVRS